MIMFMKWWITSEAALHTSFIARIWSEPTILKQHECAQLCTNDDNAAAQLLTGASTRDDNRSARVNEKQHIARHDHNC